MPRQTGWQGSPLLALKYIQMVSSRIAQARKALDLTRRELADRLGMTPEILAAFESGKLEPSLEALNRIAGETGKPAWWFLLPSNPTGFERCRKVIDEEAAVMDRVNEVLVAFQKLVHRELLPEEWPSFEDFTAEGLYGAILTGRLPALDRHDLEKVQRYVRADAGAEGITNALVYLLAIWARPRYPSGESDADYVRMITARVMNQVA